MVRQTTSASKPRIPGENRDAEIRTPHEKLAALRQLRAQMEQFAEVYLAAVSHTGGGSSALCRCAPGCPRCQVEADYVRMSHELSNLQKQARADLEHVSLTSLDRARRSRGISDEKYENAVQKLRDKGLPPIDKLIAPELGVNEKSLSRWRAKNGRNTHRSSK